MRSWMITMLAAGCCDLSGVHDPTPTDSPSGDTGSTPTNPVRGALDLSTPTGDPAYDRYTRAVMDLDLLAPPSTQPQLYEGVSGMLEYPIVSRTPRIGTVLTHSVGGWHTIEHWFVEVPSAAYVGDEGFELQFESPKGWGIAEGILLAEQPGWQSEAYLCMDIEYKASPADLDGLDLVDPDYIERWEFDVIQEGDVVASLLRELHDHPGLGQVYVDFWTFQQPGFSFVGNGASGMIVTNGPVAPAPPAIWYGNQPPSPFFARIVYKAQPGSGFVVPGTESECAFPPG